MRISWTVEEEKYMPPMVYKPYSIYIKNRESEHIKLEEMRFKKEEEVHAYAKELGLNGDEYEICQWL